MESKFKFYEVVRINAACLHSDLVGLEGTIMGMAQNEQNLWSYSVYLPTRNESWHFMEKELEPTGKQRKREDFYDGTHITVNVDPETGEGKISKYHKSD